LKKKLNQLNFLNKNYIFFLGFFLIFLNYFFSILLFGKVIIQPHDNLDNIVVYDHIISEIYNGNLQAIKIFISGEFKWYFLEEIFYPINLLHLFVNDKSFYFLENIIKLLISFFSFYIFSKSITKDKSVSTLGAILYATTTQTLNITPGLGLTFLPYFIYLLNKDHKLKTKHFLIIFLAGLNTSITHEFLSIIFILPLAFFIKKNFNKNIIFYFLIIYTIAVLLGNLPLFLASILEETHRLDFQNKRIDLISNFFLEIKSLFSISVLNTSVFNIPLKILYILLFLLIFLINDKVYKNIIIFCLIIFILKIFSNSNIIDFFFESFFSGLIFLKSFNFTRIDKIFPLIFAILLVLSLIRLNNIFLKKIIYFIAIISVVSIQIATPQLEIFKNVFYYSLKNEKKHEFIKNIQSNKFMQSLRIISDKENFSSERAFLSSNKDFDTYFRFNDYNEIKDIVKDERIMSVGLDPMIAAMNNIKVIDGYHTQYPLSYKIKFRKIIENELKKNDSLREYYDTWGSRLYAFYDDKNNLELNFTEAKSLGANFVLSSFQINSENLDLVCSNCGNSKDLFLYKIF